MCSFEQSYKRLCCPQCGSSNYEEILRYDAGHFPEIYYKYCNACGYERATKKRAPMFTKRMVQQQFMNKTDEWKIVKAWVLGDYVVIEYANGKTDKLYKAKIEWIKELEPDVEIVNNCKGEAP